MVSEQLTSEIAVRKDVDDLLRETYEPGFYAVARFVSRRGGTFDDAKDVFQDAIVLLYDRYQRGLHVESPVRYIVGIAKHLWYKELKTRRKTAELPESFDVQNEEIKSLEDKKLLVLLERAGKRCMDLLEAFYFRKDTFRSIMKTFGFGSEHSASVQKYKCIEKLRNELKVKSLNYEDFFE
jgi:RNA polymerase sigma factor (sigma-70 family)